MQVFIFLLICTSVFAHYGQLHPEPRAPQTIFIPNPPEVHSRSKRQVAGQLDIVNNHASPIHAEVKPDVAATESQSQPCPKRYIPSHIEPGTGFKVTPPKDVLYTGKSLRKSWPLTDKLDLVRSITRVVTLAILVLSAAIEFYPLIQHVYYLYYV